MKNVAPDLVELIKFVRENSQFYKELYAALPEAPKLSDLPVLPLDEFWNANGLNHNTVLTGPLKEGVIFKSGGSTGNPKFSVFTKKEWQDFTRAFGHGIAQRCLKQNDRVINLFYVGQLYGSFLFINKSIEESPIDVLQLPVGGSTDLEEVMQTIADFKADVLAGVPTTIMNLAEYIDEHKSRVSSIKIKKILFGGEPTFEDQRARLGEIFPGIEILSIGYASTDAGLLGYADSECALGEHRAFGQDTILEILNEETHEPITQKGEEGVIVVTNLRRRLMPIIRYPAGDRGMWLEPAGLADRKFKLLGRSEEAARIGLIKLYVQDVRLALEPLREKFGMADFQMLVTHRDRLDGLVLRIASRKKLEELSKFDKQIIEEIHKARPLYKEFAADHKVRPIEIEWVLIEEGQGLEINSRTGKLKRVIDKRLIS